MTGARRESGFTLIEALVALVVLSFGAVALLGAAEAHIRRIDALEASAGARWTARNALVEIRLAGAAPAQTPRETRMLGRSWRVAATTSPTDDPDLVAVRVAVASAEGDAPGAILDGFVDLGGAQ